MDASFCRRSNCLGRLCTVLLYCIECRPGRIVEPSRGCLLVSAIHCSEAVGHPCVAKRERRDATIILWDMPPRFNFGLSFHLTCAAAAASLLQFHSPPPPLCEIGPKIKPPIKRRTVPWPRRRSDGEDTKRNFYGTSQPLLLQEP